MLKACLALSGNYLRFLVLESRFALASTAFTSSSRLTSLPGVLLASANFLLISCPDPPRVPMFFVPLKINENNLKKFYFFLIFWLVFAKTAPFFELLTLLLHTFNALALNRLYPPLNPFKRKNSGPVGVGVWDGRRGSTAGSLKLYVFRPNTLHLIHPLNT